MAPQRPTVVQVVAEHDRAENGWWLAPSYGGPPDAVGPPLPRPPGLAGTVQTLDDAGPGPDEG